MATDTNRLLANQYAFIGAPAPSFYQGNVAQLELHIVASSGVGNSPVEVPFPAGAAITVAVGDTNKYPTGGTWELTVDGTETSPIPWNATITQLQEALDALSVVSTNGGVTVSKTGTGYTITWNTYGSKPTISQGSDTLTPSSYESISLVQAGDAGTRQIVFVELRQSPIAMSTTWTPMPAPTITFPLIQAWNGTNKIYRVGIDPQPRSGTIQISFGTTNATFNYNTSASVMATVLGCQVFQTGQFQWDIVLTSDESLTATGLLIGYNGYVGTINFATAECHQFLGGDSRKSTNLEVSMNVDGDQFTLLQTPCSVCADVVSSGAVIPVPLGTYLDESVANARFVRRDVSQSPDAATIDVIWSNLGVIIDGSDVADAINASPNAPTAINPIATLADLTASGLTISTLSNGATSTLDSGVPTSGQSLTFDGTSLKWSTVGGGGGWTPGSGNLDLGGYTIQNGSIDLNPSGSATSYGFAGQFITVQNVTMTSGGTLTFQDGTTMTSAAVPFNGGTVGTPITVTGSGGSVSIGDSIGLDLSGSTAGAGVKFADSTVQTTAAVQLGINSADLYFLFVDRIDNYMSYCHVHHTSSGSVNFPKGFTLWFTEMLTSLPIGDPYSYQDSLGQTPYACNVYTGYVELWWPGSGFGGQLKYGNSRLYS